jgi:phosphoenolpyruvate synthase/pyruvate phosphate dikinase
MMASSQYLFPLTSKRNRKTIGNKAKSLLALQQKGIHIPETFVCSWRAYQQYIDNDVAVVEQLQAELRERLAPDAVYAVRSSANIEDQFEQSFAGQFKSVLGVRGVDSVLQAIWSIWATARSDAVAAYLKKMLPGKVDLKMAVIVQKMIPPILSGVAFSRNPITGMDEVIVEAVEGAGTALVQEGATPFRWVHKWGQWIDLPEESPIDLGVIEQVVQQTREISGLFKLDVDLEWVYDGKQVFWLQMREITSLQDISFYSNKLAKDMLPGLITPLVFSVNVPLVSDVWIDLLTRMIGKNDLTPDILVKQFYYRAYFNMGKFGSIFKKLGLPQESLELMMVADTEKSDGKGSGMPKFKPSWKMFILLPRLLVFMIHLAFFHHQIANFLPEIEHKLRKIPIEVPEGMGTQEKLFMLDWLYRLNRQTAHFNLVGPLMMMVYSGILRGQLKKMQIDADQFDLLYGLTEIQKFDPAKALRKLNQEFDALEAGIKKVIANSSYLEFLQLPKIETFQRGVQDFLAQYGHLSDSGNDFSSVPWRENPDLILQLIIQYQVPAANLKKMLGFDDLPLKGFHRLVFGHIYRRTRLFRYFRERVNSSFTYGMGLFRVYYLSLGEELVAKGLLEVPDDVYYLYDEEVRRLVMDTSAIVELVKLVNRRKQEMEAAKVIDLPLVVFGDEPPPIELSPRKRLVGTPTSRGLCTGKARVILGMRDFDKMEEGEILVVPFSDVSWSPLFAKAAAVVSECGGMLSHSSIIAREYGIPAVVSVPDATRLLEGFIITVDGYKGEVVLLDDDKIPVEEVIQTQENIAKG